jgi:hypothetical protein
MVETLPFSGAKAHLSALAERVEREHERFAVTATAVRRSCSSTATTLQRSGRPWTSSATRPRGIIADNPSANPGSKAAARSTLPLERD